jgi:hypothetical protein
MTRQMYRMLLCFFLLYCILRCGVRSLRHKVRVVYWHGAISVVSSQPARPAALGCVGLIKKPGWLFGLF